MEENYERESDQILVYGNITESTYKEQKMFDYLANKFEK